MKKKRNLKKKQNDEKKKNIIIAIAIIMIIALISGGTYSWFMWRSANNTLVNKKVIGRGQDDTQDAGESWLLITGNNVTNDNTNNSTKPGMVPILTSNCATSPYTLIGEATVTAINGTGTDMRVTPRLDITLTTAQGTLSTTAKSHLHWALVDTTSTTSKTCVNPDYQGTFDKAAIVTVSQNTENTDVSVSGGTSLTAIGTSATINITNGTTTPLTFVATKSSKMGESVTTTKKYKVYVWLDSGYEYTNYGNTVSDPMQDLAITVKWSNGSSMIQE